jgi:hypothetical protein
MKGEGKDLIFLFKCMAGWAGEEAIGAKLNFSCEHRLLIVDE